MKPTYKLIDMTTGRIFPKMYTSYKDAYNACTVKRFATCREIQVLTVA
jgi:CobQ-like glutamine amidotransferase family enzyme